MSHAAQAVTTGELTDITVTRADGTQTKLGKPGTLRFRIRLFLYKRKLNRKGLI